DRAGGRGQENRSRNPRARQGAEDSDGGTDRPRARSAGDDRQPAPSVTHDERRVRLRRLVLLIAAIVLWFVPPPSDLTRQSWRLFDIFAVAIVSVVIDAYPILTASVFAVAASVLTGLLPAEAAYAGFANGTILLIVLAFLVARAVVKCGLGTRIG